MLRSTVGIALVALSLIFATAARAGTYDVYGCQLPNGSPIPAAGWEPAGSLQLPFQHAQWNQCASHGGLVSELNSTTVRSGEQAGWRFSAPPDTEISAFELMRVVAVSGDRQYHLAREFTREAPPAQTDAEQCVSWASGCTTLGDWHAPSPSDVLRRSGLTGTLALHVWVQCVPRSGSTCAAASYPLNGVASIWRTRITLADNFAPTFTKSVSGSLVDSTDPRAGVQYVTFGAADRGGGVQSMALMVDGAPLAMQPVDRASRTCAKPYIALVPCPLTVEPTMIFDTRALTNGPHLLRVIVTDAAGNQTQSEPIRIVTRNGSRPNGNPATRSAHLSAWFTSNRAHRTGVTVDFRGRHAIAGRLTTSRGKPIVGAVITVASRVLRPGARLHHAAAVVTDRRGRFHWRPHRGPSRLVRLTYRAYTLDEQASATSLLTYRVRAGVRLKVTPRRVHNGTVATFRGRLLAGPGRYGTLVTIYALGGPRWIPVETVSADRRGRFRYRYRFTRLTQPTTFRFRSMVKAQPDYPYARGISRLVRVRASP